MATASRHGARACPRTGTSPGGGALRDRAGAAQGRADRRRPVLRRPGRRRPAHHDPRPHRGAATARWSPTGPGSIGFLREGERVTGARVARPGDRRASSRSAPGRSINATGVWTDDTQAMVGERGQFHVRASKGIHLVVPRDRIHSDDRADPAHREVACSSSSRGAGTGSSAPPTPTGTLDKAHPAATAPTSTTSSSTSTRCSTTPLTQRGRRGRVRRAAAAAGRRVASRPRKLSREHVVAHPVPGLVVVAGGKYTTYRVMAKDAVDEAAHGAGRRVARVACTDEVPLRRRRGLPRRCGTARPLIAARSGLHVARIEHLLQPLRHR